jgi:hypothetical protein
MDIKFPGQTIAVKGHPESFYLEELIEINNWFVANGAQELKFADGTVGRVDGGVTLELDSSGLLIAVHNE